MKIQENNNNSSLRYRLDNKSNQSVMSGRFTNGSSFRLQTYNSDDEENLLQDFKRHFSTNNRQKGNHHDFVFSKDSPIQITKKQPSRYTSLDLESVGNQLLSHDHRKRTLDHYLKLQENAIIIPKKYEHKQQTLRGIKNARNRF